MNRIAELRKEKHLNQIGLAMKLNLSQYLVSAYENGKHQPSLESLIQMSRLFHVSVDYLIGNTDIRTPIEDFAKEGFSQKEIELLSLFKKLNHKDKQRTIEILKVLNSIKEEG